MEVVILCTLFVATFGRHIGDDRVMIRDLTPVNVVHPKGLNLQLMTRGGDRKFLTLNRRDSLNLNAPVYTTDEHGKVKRLEVQDSESQAYLDTDNGGAFLVKSERIKRGIYKRSIRGVLADGDHEILLEPVEESQPSRKRDIHGEVEHVMVRRKVERRHIDDGPLYDKQSSINKRYGPNDPVIVDRRSEPNITIDRRGDKPHYVVELLVAVDYEAFKRYPSVYKAKEYYGIIIAGVDLRYANIDSDFEISVKLTGYYFFMTAESSAAVFSKHVKGDGMESAPALSEFEKWRQNELSTLANHDHAMFFTGYYLMSDGEFGTVGMARSATICSLPRQAISMVADSGSFTCISTAAHELGHCLGASKHDGQENECDANDTFIMAPSGIFQGKIRKNYFKFSPCSIVQIQAKLKKLNENGNNCLNNTPSSVEPVVTKPPGQIRGVEAQCVDMNGPGSKYVPGLVGDVRCRELPCWDPNNPQHRYMTTYTDVLRGTSCGNKKWCYETECVWDKDAPAGPDNCRHGEPADRCSKVKTNTTMCYEGNTAEVCCSSCVPDFSNLDCAYGDKGDCSDRSLYYPGSIVCSVSLDVCCRSCFDQK